MGLSAAQTLTSPRPSTSGMLITYPRTDSRYLARGHGPKVRQTCMFASGLGQSPECRAACTTTAR